MVIDKVIKKAKIRNRYNKVKHSTQDTTWKSDKTTKKITYKKAKRLELSHLYSFFHIYAFRSIFGLALKLEHNLE